MFFTYIQYCTVRVPGRWGPGSVSLTMVFMDPEIEKSYQTRAAKYFLSQQQYIIFVIFKPGKFWLQRVSSGSS